MTVLPLLARFCRILARAAPYLPWGAIVRTLTWQARHRAFRPAVLS